MSLEQLRLFGRPPRLAGEPAFDPSFVRADRIALSDGAWVEHVPGWVTGDEALFEQLHRETPWHGEERRMYDRVVATPRLLGGVVGGGVVGRDGPGHPLLEARRGALTARYGEEFVRISLALYRDGKDSVALHGDTVARDMLEPTHVATVSLGGSRRLLMKPAKGGRSVEFVLRGGDLYVMGGTAQRTWRHGIPKVAEAEPRIVVMFRPRWGEGYSSGGHGGPRGG
ncbi:MAG: alpha-ketoglutarate-dependent dioxygenase AlkB [Planctomycetota bacterium]